MNCDCCGNSYGYGGPQCGCSGGTAVLENPYELLNLTQSDSEALRLALIDVLGVVDPALGQVEEQVIAGFDTMGIATQYLPLLSCDAGRRRQVVSADVQLTAPVVGDLTNYTRFSLVKQQVDGSLVVVANSTISFDSSARSAPARISLGDPLSWDVYRTLDPNEIMLLRLQAVAAGSRYAPSIVVTIRSIDV